MTDLSKKKKSAQNPQIFRNADFHGDFIYKGKYDIC